MPILHLLRQNPVIAAVKDNASLQLAIDSDCQFISVLYGNICTITGIVQKIKQAGKMAFIHVDLLEGASNKEIVIQFLKLVTQADGIISTKPNMLKAARAEGFFCIHRLFIVDSISFHNIDKQVAQSNADCIEILPGCMPKVLNWVTEKVRQPLIAGGLVCDEEDARNAIAAGVLALSTTNTDVWTLAKDLN
ncbi:glycerol-3-phosphate responsive antiterminator [Lelliottia sp. V106_10]|uniref:glycerol-3-phosphate responsive antiterminator n=1 Tax=Lelliottia wanjuensis TaxID=3050585 RepID=UPI00249E8B22|nr:MULTISPECIES: glycerol-3-phosphate responsive antiterminator [unclassified Lelliottia]MDI3360134.1 glycerol-3-phosphate responsive antiterminator [Lelliottia sp. V89_13]MDK9354610.1 glycerol-3-phosphate responsive antiterminator [Lelliottia sp. V106_16]MDK9371817.1 glycerol-3-phosphate responsive antiterminator [Lelliottia sp. V106_10]MDK9550465.1 glycerol-3-phosphate responsive antiterminator [Lelliottia sp. V89_5]MDK9594799.1 glycerol-3-phosphate responsive antiterminator [Lelliottia sp. 